MTTTYIAPTELRVGHRLIMDEAAGLVFEIVEVRPAAEGIIYAETRGGQTIPLFGGPEGICCIAAD